MELLCERSGQRCRLNQPLRKLVLGRICASRPTYASPSRCPPIFEERALLENWNAHDEFEGAGQFRSRVRCIGRLLGSAGLEDLQS